MNCIQWIVVYPSIYGDINDDWHIFNFFWKFSLLSYKAFGLIEWYFFPINDFHHVQFHKIVSETNSN